VAEEGLHLFRQASLVEALPASLNPEGHPSDSQPVNSDKATNNARPTAMLQIKLINFFFIMFCFTSAPYSDRFSLNCFFS